MSSSGHRVLLVEDDADTREELEEILRSLNCEVVSCDNKQTALQHIASGAFCMAVLDLQVFGEPGAIRAYEDHGRGLVREIRRAYPDHSGTSFTFPIIVISGYANEWEAAKEVSQDGASDIIRKPPKSGEVSRAVRDHFARSGRSSHADCATIQTSVPARTSELELSIPATRDGRRTEVKLGARSAFLPDRLLVVLLHLVKGHLAGKRVHKVDMGDTGTGGFKLPSELNNEMKPAYPPDIDALVVNHYNGEYALIESVTIGDVNIEGLNALDHGAISDLASEIEDLLSKCGGNS